MDSPKPLITPEQARRLNAAIAEFGRAVREQIIEPALRIGRAMRLTVWDGYRAAGMPYGETEDGMMRWFEEQGAVARAKREREYEAERAEAVASFAARLRETT